ncbi:hypothetical protein [Paenibacillus sp. Marseille-Q4541]|uniref:hypothetical protein n=1 Tax=Paenibacillus sp. Marseille-Q4541 TaxID=2831522 RepID=UPI001BAB9742|nr:hypothetical protein [Paenibacillus sp. Marseille-Q4541]
MYQETNERLALLKEKGRLLHKWTSREENLLQLEKKTEELLYNRKEHLVAEQKDVDQLLKTSLASLFYSVIGRKEERLEKEEKELLESKALYEEACHALQNTRKQLTEVRNEIAALHEWQHWRQEYDQIMAAKQKSLAESDTFIQQCLEHEVMLKGQLKEVEEAEKAGHSVLDCLDEAEESLKSAGNWGTYDMLGGGMISTHIKHSRLDDAENHVHDAQLYLRKFQEELRDVDVILNSNFEIQGMLTFADYFLDGFFSDWLVQSKIHDAQDSVCKGMGEVGRVLIKLDTTKRNLQTELAKWENQRKKAVEEA